MKLLLDLIKNATRLCFVDFEGTQLEHEIIAIGAVVASVDEHGHIVAPYKEFKMMVKAKHKVGKVITNLTGITDSMLDDAESFDIVVSKLKEFLLEDGEPIENTKFVCFGEQDRLMMKVSAYLTNKMDTITFFKQFSHNYIDFSAFLSNFITDKKRTKLSLVNFVHYFDEDTHGASHDPLNDAYDLLNLYKCFYTKTDYVKKGYTETLLKQMPVPSILKPSVNKILKGRNVKHSEFLKDVDEYFK